MHLTTICRSWFSYYIIWWHSVLAWLGGRHLYPVTQDSVESYPHCVMQCTADIWGLMITLWLCFQGGGILKGRVERGDVKSLPRRGCSSTRASLRNGAYSGVQRIMGSIREASVPGARVGRKPWLRAMTMDMVNVE